MRLYCMPLKSKCIIYRSKQKKKVKWNDCLGCFVSLLIDTMKKRERNATCLLPLTEMKRDRKMRSGVAENRTRVWIFLVKSWACKHLKCQEMLVCVCFLKFPSTRTVLRLRKGIISNLVHFKKTLLSGTNQWQASLNLLIKHIEVCMTKQREVSIAPAVVSWLCHGLCQILLYREQNILG